MGVFGKGLFVAFDAASVSVATFARGPRRGRLAGFQRGALEPGAIEPSPTGPNVARPQEVAEALAQALGDELRPGRPATLVLPDGLARLAVIEPPRGAEPRDYVRYRLSASLPWPVAEAIVDVLPLRRGRVVGAAVRRATVAEYEQVATTVGLSVDRVNLAPLLALDALLARSRKGRPVVHAILGDVAVSLALVQEGQLLALRCRRRDPSVGEGTRLVAEAERTTRQAGNGHGEGAVPLVLSGSGAALLQERIGPATTSLGFEGPKEWPESTEAVWLSGALR